MFNVRLTLVAFLVPLLTTGSVGLMESAVAEHDSPVGQYNQVVSVLKNEYYDANATANIQPATGKMTAAERDAAIRKLVGLLPDQWSHYQAPGDTAPATMHPGFLLKREGEALVVDLVAFSTPAFFADVRRGDCIVAIDGVPVKADAVPSEVLDSLMRARGKRAVLSCIDKEARPAGQPHDVVLHYQPPNAGVPQNGQGGILPNGVWYFRITDLLDDHDEQVLKTFAASAHRMWRRSGGKIPGVVLDLRNCPGGVEHIAQKLAGVFRRPGVFGYNQTRKGEQEVQVMPCLGWLPGDEKETVAIAQQMYTTPLVVLVNESTCSAAEALAAALRESDRACLMGTRTYGKGATIDTREFDFGGQLALVVGTMVGPRRVKYEKVGIATDVEVTQPRHDRFDHQVKAAALHAATMPRFADSGEPVPMPVKITMASVLLKGGAVVLLVVLLIVLVWRRRASARKVA